MDHRRKLLRSLGSSVILHERIETTLQQARAVRPYVEKLITRAKEDTLHNRRLILSAVTRNAAKKLLEVYGPKYKERKGGYLRLTKLIHPNTGNSRVAVELVE